MTNEGFDYNSTLHVNPVNTTIYKCNETISIGNYAASSCGCSDCPDSCPYVPPPPAEIICKLWGYNCIDTTMAILFSIMSLSFLTGLFISTRISRVDKDGKTKIVLIKKSVD